MDHVRRISTSSANKKSPFLISLLKKKTFLWQANLLSQAQPAWEAFSGMKRIRFA